MHFNFEGAPLKIRLLCKSGSLPKIMADSLQAKIFFENKKKKKAMCSDNRDAVLFHKREYYRDTEM